MGQLEVLNPTAEARTTELPLARRTADLTGKSIGFLNNRKANAGLLLEKVEAILRTRLGAFSRISGEKNASLPAPDEVLTRLAQCDAAVVAIGDWGSCTSWGLHDTIELEKRGVPTAVICSDEFAPLGRAESQTLGMGGIPIAVIPHPLAGNTPDEVERKARAVADEVMAILTRPADQLIADYRGRFLRPMGKQLRQRSA